MVGNVAFSIFFKIMGDIPNASYSLIVATFMMVILQGDN